MTPETDEDRMVKQARGTLVTMPWMGACLLLGLAFTFSAGFIGLPGMAVACVAGLLLFVCLIVGWRSRRPWLAGVGFVLFLFGPKVIGFNHAHLPLPLVFQWTCLAMLIPMVPVVCFRKAVMKFARLDGDGSLAG